MGNHLSCKTDVSHLFQGPMPKERPGPFTVRIIMNNIFENCSPLSMDLVIHHQLSIRSVDSESPEPNYVWNVPKNTMRDFEVIDAFTPQSKKLAQGQVIGIVIVECMNAYVKVHWKNFDDYAKETPIEPIFTRWGHDNSAKDVLINDLSIGHHVLYLAGEDGKSVHYLHEDDDGERKEAKIYLPGLAGKGLTNFEKYVKDKQKEAKEEEPIPKKRKIDESNDV